MYFVAFGDVIILQQKKSFTDNLAKLIPFEGKTHKK